MADELSTDLWASSDRQRARMGHPLSGLELESTENGFGDAAISPQHAELLRDRSRLFARIQLDRV